MTEVSQTTIERVLEIYNPDSRVLQEANINYPVVNGKFFVGQCSYASRFEHITDIEVQLCLNQILYVTTHEAIVRKLDEGLRGLDFFALQKEGMLITHSRKRFRKQIPSDRSFRGSMVFKNRRMYQDRIFYSVDFDFENKSCVGDLELVVVKPQ